MRWFIHSICVSTFINNLYFLEFSTYSEQNKFLHVRGEVSVKNTKKVFSGAWNILTDSGYFGVTDSENFTPFVPAALVYEILMISLYIALMTTLFLPRHL